MPACSRLQDPSSTCAVLSLLISNSSAALFTADMANTAQEILSGIAKKYSSINKCVGVYFKPTNFSLTNKYGDNNFKINELNQPKTFYFDVGIIKSFPARSLDGRRAEALNGFSPHLISIIYHIFAQAVRWCQLTSFSLAVFHVCAPLKGEYHA